MYIYLWINMHMNLHVLKLYTGNLFRIWKLQANKSPFLPPTLHYHEISRGFSTGSCSLKKRTLCNWFAFSREKEMVFFCLQLLERGPLFLLNLHLLEQDYFLLVPFCLAEFSSESYLIHLFIDDNLWSTCVEIRKRVLLGVYVGGGKKRPFSTSYKYKHNEKKDRPFPQS